MLPIRSCVSVAGGGNRNVPDRDSETIVYLLRIGGMVYLQGGENHVPAGAWLQRGVELGYWPDLRGSSGQFQGSRSVDAILKVLGPGMLLPRHECSPAAEERLSLRASRSCLFGASTSR